MMFASADQPWFPTLLDIERLKAEDSPGGVEWKRYGFDALEIPEDAIHIKERMTTLNTRFIAKYGWRMISYETMEQWQTKLQEKMDSVADKYERAYTLYEENHDALMKDVFRGTKTTLKDTNTSGGEDSDEHSGTDTSESVSKTSDTPDSSINESSDYAGATSKGKTTSTLGTKLTRKYGRSDIRDSEQTTVLTGGEMIDAINGSIDGWRDIDTSFIMEFQNLFQNVFWY